MELFSNFPRETTHFTEWWLSIKDTIFFAFTCGNLPKQSATVHPSKLNYSSIHLLFLGSPLGLHYASKTKEKKMKSKRMEERFPNINGQKEIEEKT